MLLNSRVAVYSDALELANFPGTIMNNPVHV